MVGAAEFSVIPETLSAGGRTFGGGGTRPFCRVDAAAFAKHENEDAAVGSVIGVALVEGLLGRGVLFVTFCGLIVVGLLFCGKEEERVKLAAALIVALAGGIGASGEEVCLGEFQRRRDQFLEIGLDECGVLRAGGEAREILHHFALLRSPIFLVRDGVPQLYGRAGIAIENEKGVDRGSTASAQMFVVVIVTDGIRMAKDRKRAAWVGLNEGDQVLQFGANVVRGGRGNIGRRGGNKGGVESKADVVNTPAGDGNTREPRVVELAGGRRSNEKLRRGRIWVRALNATVGGAMNRALFIAGHA